MTWPGPLTSIRRCVIHVAGPDDDVLAAVTEYYGLEAGSVTGALTRPLRVFGNLVVSASPKRPSTRLAGSGGQSRRQRAGSLVRRMEAN